LTDKNTRQSQLSRRMRRALIALQVQTPQPLVTRLPVSCYYVSIAVLLLLLLLVSTRSALVYRAELRSLEARVLYVQRSNHQQQQARSAALIAFQQRPVPVIKTKNRPVEVAQQEQVTKPEPVPPLELPPVVVKPKMVVAPPVAQTLVKPRVIISSSLSQAEAPRSVDNALHRLREGRDDVALRWLASRVQALLKNPSWSVFRHFASETHSAEHHYQLGVLLNAINETDQGLKWLSKAVSKKADARYLRAFAIAADSQGLRSAAIEAYRQYLADPEATNAAEILSRLSTLEAS